MSGQLTTVREESILSVWLKVRSRADGWLLARPFWEKIPCSLWSVTIAARTTDVLRELRVLLLSYSH